MCTPKDTHNNVHRSSHPNSQRMETSLSTMEWINKCVIFPCSSAGKEFACSAEDPGSIPGLGRSPGEGNGKPLQYPCLENPMDRGAWWAAVHRISKSPGMTERLILSLSCPKKPPAPQGFLQSIFKGQIREEGVAGHQTSSCTGF